MIPHGLTIDLEEWFHVLNLRHLLPPERWEGLESRLGDPTARLLDMLAAREARATFFCLGWSAERAPDLVRRIAAAGHEIASHGYGHRRLHELGPDGFREDLARSVTVLEDITGRPPQGYRACSFSVTPDTRWGLEEIAAQGFRYDSSIYPVLHPDYGWPGFPTHPVRLALNAGPLVEFPPLTLGLLGRAFAVGGGAYLRLLPAMVVSRVLRRRERQGRSGCIYLHPWELDPGQPRQPVGGLRRLRHYTGLRRMARKVDHLLQRHTFRPLGEVVAGLPELPLYNPGPVAD